MDRVTSLLFCLFISISSFAQNPKAIEADLLKSFKKINESSTNENLIFAKNLKRYIDKNPEIINNPFKSLINMGMAISTSDDRLFRIYSWDDKSGGTMRFYDNVIQYKVRNKAYGVLDTPKKQEGASGSRYYQVYSMKVGNQTYYLASFLDIGSTRFFGYGLQIFTIENGKLNTNAKIIKTKTGFHSQLSYEYDATLSDSKIRPDFHYDSTRKTIKFPLTNESGRISTQFITYKFTGKYFEKVKS